MPIKITALLCMLVRVLQHGWKSAIAEDLPDQSSTDVILNGGGEESKLFLHFRPYHFLGLLLSVFDFIAYNVHLCIVLLRTPDKIEST